MRFQACVPTQQGGTYGRHCWAHWWPKKCRKAPAVPCAISFGVTLKYLKSEVSSHDMNTHTAMQISSRQICCMMVMCSMIAVDRPSRWRRMLLVIDCWGCDQICWKIDLAATAVARQWLDWMPPTVTTLSLPFSMASESRNSSFLTYADEIYCWATCQNVPLLANCCVCFSWSIFTNFNWWSWVLIDCSRPCCPHLSFCKHCCSCQIRHFSSISLFMRWSEGKERRFGILRSKMQNHFLRPASERR